jgi:hypothetical protein
MVYEPKEGLKVSPLAGACHAWNGTNNGVYVRTPNQINHAICRIKPPANQKLMDSYEPFQKVMADDYIFMDYGIRYVIKDVPQETEPKKKGVIKTIKFVAPPVYMVGITNPKELLHIKDEDTWATMKRMGFVSTLPDEEIGDAYFPQYDVLPKDLETSTKIEPYTNPFSSLIAWLVGLFGKKKGKK